MSKPKLNPVTTHREFSGLPGALGITFFLPALLVFFELVTNEKYSAQGLTIDFDAVFQQLPSFQGWLDLAFDKTCWMVYSLWFFGLAILDLLVQGKKMKGVELRDGTKLNYNINGIYIVSILLTIMLARLFSSQNWFLIELEFLYNHIFQLILVTVIFSWLLAVFVYVCSFIPLSKPNGVNTNERILSINGNTNNIIYDWFIGRELNPRIGNWDIKLYCELKPGMLLWFLINLSCIHHQYHTQNTITDSIILVTALQSFYIFDGVLNEEGVLTMIDITTDGFGFMLSFGDLAWLPWSYSLQTRYLCLPQNQVNLGWFKVSLIVLLSMTGYYIFHSANKQKSDFRQGNLDHLNLKSIKTNTGSKLLVDGWWGLSQHINYFGDWLIGWSWCLPTGFRTILTYFYVIYFGTLLIHRQVRDEAKCRDKYGKYWVEYETQVPYKIIPYVY